MELLFIICTALGGTVMVAQFILSMAGVGMHDGLDGGGFDHDAGGGHEPSGNLDAEHAVLDPLSDHAGHDHAEHHPAHGSTWFFGVITFRAVVAAITFFGLSGMAATRFELETPQPFLVALGSGVAALYGVHFLMLSLHRLKADGTQRIERAIGGEGVVYLGIPAHGAGPGKVHLTLQNRLVEVAATTAGERLPTGTRIVVVGIHGSDEVQVERAPEIARNTHA